MNLQTFIEAVPGYLWSDGSGSPSGLAMTAELFLLSLVPGTASIKVCSYTLFTP